MAVSKKQFQRYLKVQQSGKFDMIKQKEEAIAETGIPPAKYEDILINYSKYFKKFIGINLKKNNGGK